MWFPAMTEGQVDVSTAAQLLTDCFDSKCSQVLTCLEESVCREGLANNRTCYPVDKKFTGRQ